MESSFANRKIYKIAKETKSGGKILDISDMLEFKEDFDGKDPVSYGKLVLTLTEYDPAGNKPSQTFRHYLDLPVAIQVLTRISLGRYPKPLEQYREKQEYAPLVGPQGGVGEYKGGKVGKADNPAWQCVSRNLKIERTDKLQIGTAIRITFEVREGVKGNKGQVLPKEGAQKTRGSMTLSLQEAELMAGMVLTYIQSKLAALQTVLLAAEQRARSQGMKAAA